MQSTVWTSANFISFLSSEAPRNKWYLPFDIFFGGATAMCFASWTVIYWPSWSLEYHAHLNSLARGEAEVPFHFKIDIFLRGGILDDKITSFNHF